MSTEERVRTAAEATAASVRQIRPLALPENSAVSAGPRPHRGGTASRLSAPLKRFRETWLIPLAAAAVVAAVALALVTLRHGEGPPPAPTQASTVAPKVTGIPRYFAIATEGPYAHDQKAAINVTVGDVYTGKTLATVALPRTSVASGSNAAVGVSATADDRTFIVGSRDDFGGIGYYAVRIAPGTKQVATFKLLPIPKTSIGVLLGFAVSPDGSELAALSVRGNGTTLTIFSVKSGATLRTWTAAAWRNQGYGVVTPGISWTAGSRDVAFSTVVTTGPNRSGVLAERLIGAAAPSGDLAAASKVIFKAPGNCTSLLLTPDGGTVVCATQVGYAAPFGSSTSCGTDGRPMFVAYSAATGKRLRVLFQYTGPCELAVDTVLWADNSARHVIGETEVDYGGSPPRDTDGYGVAAAGQFARFAVPRLGQWYSGPAF